MNLGDRRKDEFARMLKNLRRNAGLRQEDIADLLSVTNSTVSVWERGEGYPRIDTLIALSELLDTNVIALLGIQLPVDIESGHVNLQFQGESLTNREKEMIVNMLQAYRLSEGN